MTFHVVLTTTSLSTSIYTIKLLLGNSFKHLLVYQKYAIKIAYILMLFVQKIFLFLFYQCKLSDEIVSFCSVMYLLAYIQEF